MHIILHDFWRDLGEAEKSIMQKSTVTHLTSNNTALYWSVLTTNNMQTVWKISGDRAPSFHQLPSNTPLWEMQLVWSPWCSCYHLGWGCLQILPECTPGLLILHCTNHAAAFTETGWLQARQEMKRDNDRSVCRMSALSACSYPHNARLAPALIDLTDKNQSVSPLTALSSLMTIALQTTIPVMEWCLRGSWND